MRSMFLLIISIITPLQLYGVEPLPQNLWQGIIAENTTATDSEYIAIVWCVNNRLAKNLNPGLSALKRKNLEKFVEENTAYIKKTTGRDLKIVTKKIIADIAAGRIADPTHGATHYENIEAFGVPYWAKNMRICVKIGKHTFYK